MPPSMPSFHHFSLSQEIFSDHYYYYHRVILCPPSHCLTYSCLLLLNFCTHCFSLSNSSLSHSWTWKGRKCMADSSTQRHTDEALPCQKKNKIADLCLKFSCIRWYGEVCRMVKFVVWFSKNAYHSIKTPKTKKIFPQSLCESCLRRRITSCACS